MVVRAGNPFLTPDQVVPISPGSPPFIDGNIDPGTLTLPTPDGGGGEGEGGGRGGAPAASNASWQQLFEEQRRQAERMRQRLENEYSSRRDDLRSQYQFAETEQEKAQLAFLMAELESATERGYQAISTGYSNAVESIQQTGQRAGESTSAEAAAVQNLFLSSSDRMTREAGQAMSQSGLGAGLAGRAMEPASDFANLLSADAAREAALSQRLGGVVERDFLDAERRMAMQQASQEADLGRLSLQSGAQTRADQQAAVAARIAADRRDFSGNLRQLQTQYATLGAGFDQASLASYGNQAEQQLAEQMFLQNMAFQERQAAANRAAQMQMLEAQWGREDSQRPAWQTDDLTQRLLAWESLPDTSRSEENYRKFFGGLLPGVEPWKAPPPGPPEGQGSSGIPLAPHRLPPYSGPSTGPVTPAPAPTPTPQNPFVPGVTMPPGTGRAPIPPNWTPSFP